jgi:F-type H+-transporting ATPase subunit epsilon
MADTFQLEVVTPWKQLVNQKVEFAEIPGRDGYMGILPGHAALLSMLGTGDLTYKLAGQTGKVRVMGGYVEVRDDHVRVLADQAE